MFQFASYQTHTHVKRINTHQIPALICYQLFALLNKSWSAHVTRKLRIYLHRECITLRYTKRALCHVHNYSIIIILYSVIYLIGIRKIISIFIKEIVIYFLFGVICWQFGQNWIHERIISTFVYVLISDDLRVVRKNGHVCFALAQECTGTAIRNAFTSEDSYFAVG